MDIISSSDLLNVPGIPGDADMEYLANRASAAVVSQWCTPVDPVPEWVRFIAIDLVIRNASNPQGLASVTWSRSVDDASRSRTDRFTPGTTTQWGLTEDERRKLCPGTQARRRVGSIRLRVPGFQP